jgi:hypothetical protein
VVKVYDVTLLMMKYDALKLEEKEIVVMDENDVEMVVKLYAVGLLMSTYLFE